MVVWSWWAGVKPFATQLTPSSPRCPPKGCLCLDAVTLPPFCSPPRGTLPQGPSWGTRWTLAGSFPSPPKSSKCSQMWVDATSLYLTLFSCCLTSWWDRSGYQEPLDDQCCLSDFNQSVSSSSRICHIPNHSTRNVLSLEMAASSRTANVERKLTRQILCLGILNILLQCTKMTTIHFAHC